MISGCGGAPARCSVASVPGRSSEVVMPMRGRISPFVGHQRGKLHVPLDEPRAPALARVSNRNG